MLVGPTPVWVSEQQDGAEGKPARDAGVTGAAVRSLHREHRERESWDGHSELPQRQSSWAFVPYIRDE